MPVRPLCPSCERPMEQTDRYDGYLRTCGCGISILRTRTEWTVSHPADEPVPLGVEYIATWPTTFQIVRAVSVLFATWAVIIWAVKEIVS